MNVYGIQIPNKPWKFFELLNYAEELKIPHFRGDLPKLSPLGTPRSWTV
jgi:hypothetical protein